MSDTPYFQKHVFVCMNQREDGRACCGPHAEGVQKYMKQKIKALDLNGKGKIRINQSGCLDRCDEGPVMVVYPQGTWYTYVDQSDIDEIVEKDLIGNEVVERLKI